MWNGWGPRCFLLQNKEVLQRFLLQKLFLQLEKSQHTGQTSGILHIYNFIKQILNVFLIKKHLASIKLCCMSHKGETTNKKSEGLTETAAHGKIGSLCTVSIESAEPC